MKNASNQSDLTKFPGGLQWVQSRLDGGIRYEIGTMVAEPNKVAVQVESFGKTTEGVNYNNLYHVYFELDGCKIIRVREYKDIFRDEDLTYAQQLTKAGVPVELHLHSGAPHGYDRIATGSKLIQRAMKDRIRVIQSI